ncbi:hypothetical protein K7472_20710 [Streptomyces sp. PTM05]|uniref:Uncharacterized protein n=1 Tax=Streptantibioticus parmotrematis TaxID=2873249 RepID=A0ABS7QZQ0_9ACTN|nr:hypothetical protein [Streptantibioticus parmotrematis]MBY8887249.1 hypothetical protein [Streptantibioticus parmotrematis]
MYAPVGMAVNLAKAQRRVNQQPPSDEATARPVGLVLCRPLDPGPPENA